MSVRLMFSLLSCSSSSSRLENPTLFRWVRSHGFGPDKNPAPDPVSNETDIVSVKRFGRFTNQRLLRSTSIKIKSIQVFLRFTGDWHNSCASVFTQKDRFTREIPESVRGNFFFGEFQKMVLIKNLNFKLSCEKTKRRKILRKRVGRKLLLKKKVFEVNAVI